MIDTQTVRDPALPRDATPSEIVHSLSEDHRTVGRLKIVVAPGSYRWCCSGWLLEQAGVTWGWDDWTAAFWPLAADGRLMKSIDAAAACGLTQNEYQRVVGINDTRGREAVIRYLEGIGK